MGQLRTLAAQQTASLFNHLVSAAEQLQRGRETEGPGSFEINDQFDFFDLLDWQVARLFALENFPGIAAEQTVVVGFTASVADQPAGCRERATLEDRGCPSSDR